MRLRALAVAVALATSVVAPATAGSIGSLEQQLQEARDRRAAVEARLATEAGDLEGLAEQVTEAEQAVAAVDARDAELRSELDEVAGALADRSRAAFMRGEQTALHVLVSARDLSDVAEGAALLESLALRDRANLEEAEALRVALAANRELRAERLDELSALEADLQQRVERLMEDLDQLQRDEERFGAELEREREAARRRAAEEERRRRAAEQAAAAAEAPASSAPASSAPAPVASGGLACPVGNPVAFSDTWGAPRSGGRRHQGVDMMARHGTPVYAITSGKITRMRNSSLGGLTIYMYGDDGIEYYYAHLQDYASGISSGQRVAAGDRIASVGSTGNASASAPHLHFEVHPGGGSAVNPYPYAARACGR